MYIIPKIGGFILFAIIIGLITILWIRHSVYDRDEYHPDRLYVDALESAVDIHWRHTRTAEIQASSVSDALVGLGYVQGQLNGWTIALWRQAALGKLSQWYGSEMIPADRLIHQLGLYDIAQEISSHLDSIDTERLTAYGKGVQLAWQSKENIPEFLLKNIHPDPWEPWHTLAVERLTAWMSSSPDSVCSLGVSICEGTKQLRSALLLHGLELSSSWVLPTDQGPLLYQRNILGSGISPIFQEVVLRVSDELEIRGASLVGTPFFPAGKTDSHAWSLLLHSPKTTGPIRSGLNHTERLKLLNQEEIVSYQRSDSTFSIPDSHRELLWSGFGPEADILAWFSLLEDPSPTAFHLWEGGGILVFSDNTWNVLGNPKFIFPIHDEGLVISNDSSARHTASYLQNRDMGIHDPEEWITDTKSIWAADTLSKRLESLHIPAHAPSQVHSALTYLKNWDYHFKGTSIGATIYHAWITLKEPDLTVSFYTALDQLTREFGADQSKWLWERVHTDTLRFTFYGPSDNRIYAPLISPVTGHESTMIWGGTRAVTSPITWEAWTRVQPENPYFIRRHDLDLHQPFGRYISGKSGSSVFTLSSSSLKTTHLVPHDLQ